MESMYLVKAGFQTKFFKDFEDGNYIGLPSEFRDLSNVNSKEELRKLAKEVYPELDERNRRNITNIIGKLLFDFNIDDYVITYDEMERQYLIGNIVSDYKYVEDIDTPHTWDMKRIGKINRDDLHGHVKKNLEDSHDIFKISAEYASEVLDELAENPA